MTVIVAIRDGKSAVIGADSGLAVGDLSVVSADSKIVRIGRDVAFGIAGPTSAARIAEKAVAERWPSVIHCPSARDVAECQMALAAPRVDRGGRGGGIRPRHR